MGNKTMLYVMLVVLCIGLLGPVVSVLKPTNQEPTPDPTQSTQQPPSVLTTVEEYFGVSEATVLFKDKILFAFPSGNLETSVSNDILKIPGVTDVKLGNQLTISLSSPEYSESVSYIIKKTLPNTFLAVLSQATVELPDQVNVFDQENNEKIVDLPQQATGLVQPQTTNKEIININLRVILSQEKISDFGFAELEKEYTPPVEQSELTSEIIVTKVLKNGVKHKVQKQLDFDYESLNTDNITVSLLETADLLKVSITEETRNVLDLNNVSFLEAGTTFFISPEFNQTLTSLDITYESPTDILIAEADIGFDLPEPPGELIKEYTTCEVSLPKLEDIDLTELNPFVSELPRGTVTGTHNAKITLNAVFGLVEGVELSLED